MIFTSAFRRTDAEASSASVVTGVGEGVGVEIGFATGGADVITGVTVGGGVVFFFGIVVTDGVTLATPPSSGGSGEVLGITESVDEEVVVRVCSIV